MTKKEKIEKVEAQTEGTEILYEKEKVDVVASEKLVNLTNSVKVLKEIQKRSDYSISFALNLINKHHKDEIKEIGYKSVEEYAYSNFNYSKSTFHNYVKIAERFITPKIDVRKSLSSACFEISTIMTNDCFTVLEDIDGYPFTISQMLEMLPLTDDEIKEHIEEFSAGDTTKTIRNKVNAIRSSISTTAEEVLENQTEQTETQTVQTEQTETQTVQTDDTSRILTILEIVNKLENDDIRNKLVEVINSVINS